MCIQIEEKTLRCKNDSKKIENLALEGGGVWGIAYAGAIEELEKAGVLGGIKRVAGTSAGSIVALLLALGYGSNDISRIVAQLDFTNFMDNHSVKQLFSNYGLYQGEFALKLFRSWILEKLGSENATFKELMESGGLELRVFSSNLNTKQLHEFSYSNTPNVP